MVWPLARAAAHGRAVSVHRLQASAAGLAVFTTRGPVLEQADGGFVWVCSRPYGDTGQAFVPPLARTDSGALLASSLTGVFRREASSCDWVSTGAPLAALVVTDVVALPGAPARVFAVTSEPNDQNVIASSVDDGASFSTFAVGLDRMASVRADVTGALVAAAGARFAAGFPEVGVLWWSDDGGASYTRLEVPLLGDEQGLHVEAIGATDSATTVIWVRTRTARAVGSADERVLRVIPTGPGAADIATVTQAPVVHDVSPVSGDSDAVWVATDAGLRRASGVGVVEFSSVVATAVLDGPGGLLVAPLPGDRQPVAVARVDPSGELGESLLDYDEITERDLCVGGDDAAVCELDFHDALADFAGFGGELPPVRRAGGCSIGNLGDRGPWCAWTAILVLGWAWHRRGSLRPKP